jgi:hypothetical protein
VFTICRAPASSHAVRPREPANPKGRAGAPDDFAWNITENPVHVHDMQATLLHLCGIDHTRLTFRYQGRQYRLTDVHSNVVQGILA